MRELRFRAWDSEKKVMYTFDLLTYMMYQEDAQEELCPCEARNKGLMQFTGLKDKNGIDIYEGDVVVSFKKDYEDEPSTNAVEFEKGCWHLFAKNKNDIPLFNYSSKHLEVIGNIHENPELLP